MKLTLKKGTTSFLAAVFLQDSSSTTGAGKSGLTNASSGLTCYRARADDGNAAGTQLSLSAGTRGTWSSGGFKEKDATNLPGVYELGLDDNGLATGSNWVVYYLQGAANLAPCVLEIQLVNYDPTDAVRLGLTALPNVVSGSAGALPTTGTGSNQISVSGGNVSLSQSFPTNFSSLSIDTNGRVKIQSGVTKNVANAAFPFVLRSSSDHTTPVTGATVTATRSLDGAAFAACTNSPTEVGSGLYVLSLAAGDLNGNDVVLKFAATGADTLLVPVLTTA